MKRRSKIILFTTAYFSYASIYIARLNLTVASPVMQDEQLMGAAQIGLMGGIFFLLYSLGQLLNGFLGDILPPKCMVMAGLFLTGISNLGIGMLPGQEVIIALWGINGFAQSMLWGPLLRTIAGHFPARRKPFAASLLVSSVGVGSVLGVFLATAAIYFGNIRYAFVWPGLIALFAFLITGLLFHAAPASSPLPKAGKLSGLFTPNLLLLLTAALFHGVLKDNINLWVASYFTDTFSVDLLTMSFYVFAVPLLTLAGRLLYPPVYRLLGGREHVVSIAALSLAAVSLIPLCLPGTAMIPAAVCFSISAAAVSMVNTSFLTICPMHYEESGCVSKVVGLMDFATYMGAGISSSFYGAWLENHSYTGMFLSWIVLSGLAVMILLVVQKRSSLQKR